MKHLNQKRLVLHKEILRSLTKRDLKEVAGGNELNGNSSGETGCPTTIFTGAWVDEKELAVR